jgi:hypothetical protein
MQSGQRAQPLQHAAKHQYQILPDQKSESLELVCGFAAKSENSTLTTFKQTSIDAAQKNWNTFLANRRRD